MTNLSPSEQADFERRCARQRDIARTSPCFHPGQALMECYRFNCGPFNLVFTQDRFIKPPVWHGTVSYFKEISSEAVRDEAGRYIFDAPQDAMMAVRSWDKEEYQIARDLLSKAFGEIIARPDTRVMELKGVMALHWCVEVLDA